MTLNAILEALCDELAADGVPAPLAQSFSLATLWADLARLAGEEPPPAVVALLGTPEPAPGELYWYQGVLTA